ncbi:MAG TPA: hypothetical protein VGK74_08425 [Symbiobacteriaceae bacterium]|jgi:hypothetical protein
MSLWFSHPAMGSPAMGGPYPGDGSYPGGGPPAAGGAPSPLSRMAAYGVPISFTAGGRPVIRGGMNGNGIGMPPEIAGMPKMPLPPPGFPGATRPPDFSSPSLS